MKLQLALAFGGITVAAFSTFGFASLAPEIRAQFGLSTAAVGAVGAMAYVGSLIATVPAGRVTDRMGATRMLALALVLIATGVSVAAGAPTALLLLAGVGLAGIGYGAANPPSNVLASASVPRGRRAVVMSIKQVGVTAGGVLAGLILPSLALLGSWRTALLVPLVACLATGLIALRLARSPERSAVPMPAERHAGTVSMSGMGVYGFVLAGVQNTIISYVAVYLVDHEHLSVTAAGIGLAVTMLGGAVGRFGWGVASDRLFDSRLQPLQLAAAGAAVGLAVLPWTDGAVVYVALALVGLCAIGWNGVYLTMTAESAPTSVGRATGRALFWLYAGAVAAPPLFGLLVGGPDSWALLWSAMALAVAAALAVLTLQQARSPGVPITMEEAR
jgi:MFS family permease